MKGNRIVAVCFVLLAYVGQSLASASMPCAMDMHSESSTMQGAISPSAVMDHTGMDHSRMNHAGMDHSLVEQGAQGHLAAAAQGDCCEESAFCDVSHCQASAALLASATHATPVSGYHYLVPADTGDLQHDSTSPFRPPISL
tara:strand:- start:152756 stop:153181 length:426 start_codon:yes stop_codon:yes gene_type:complete